MARIEVDGVTLHDGGPVGNVAFRLGRGVDVFYGRNGAGKSILLRRIADALSGAERPWDLSEVGGESFVHARVVEANGSDAEHHKEYSVATPDEHLAEAVINTLADGRPSEHLYPVVERGLTLPDVAASACRRHLEQGLNSDWVGYLQLRSEVETPTAEQMDRWVEVAASSDRIAFRVGGGSLLFTAFRLDEIPPAARSDFEVAVMSGYELIGGGIDDLASSIADYGDPPDIEWLAQHPWASVPWLNSGMLQKFQFRRVIELDDQVDLDALTCEVLLSSVEKPDDRVGDFAGLIAIAPNGRYGMARPLVDQVERFEALANEVYSHLLIDAPPLRLVLTPPTDVFLGARFFTWRGVDPTGAGVPLSKLSTAQRRWARFSVNVALGLFDGTESSTAQVDAFLVVDEPEVALHPTAQRFLATGFEWLSESFSVTILAASHSVAFLAPERFRLHHVFRGFDGRVELEALPSAFAVDSATLGVDQGDLLALTRVIMVVEGRHDELILRELFGQEFRDAGITVLAARGGSGLESVTAAGLLFDSTDAQILAVVDNVDGAVVAETVATALRLATEGDRSAAVDRLDTGLSSKVSEQKFIKEFAIRAIDRNREDRVSVWGLEAPDVLDYLPVQSLCRSKRARGASWADLRSERSDDPQPKKNFKEWARQHLAFNDDDETIIAAVRSLDSIPSDLTDLLAEATRLANRPWGSPFAATDA